MGGKGLGGRKVSEKKAETLPKGQVRFHILALRSCRPFTPEPHSDSTPGADERPRPSAALIPSVTATILISRCTARQIAGLYAYPLVLQPVLSRLEFLLFLCRWNLCKASPAPYPWIRLQLCGAQLALLRCSHVSSTRGACGTYRHACAPGSPRGVCRPPKVSPHREPLVRQQAAVPPPGDTATPRTSVDVERTPPSFAGGSNIFDIENPEALARVVVADEDADGAKE